MTEVNHVLWVEPGKAEVIEKPFPKVGEGFVIVKVHIAPVCTEYKTYATGFLEAYERNDRLGHEGVGEIHSVGPGVSGLREGDRVILYQGWACGECWVCRHGLGATHCVERPVRRGAIESANQSESGGGGFSRYRLAPANMVQRIPVSLPFEYASAANCLMGCTFSAVREHAVGPEHYCLVAGVGFLGHAMTVHLKHRGAKVIALGRNPFRMALARQLGADLIVNPDDSDWLDQIRDFTPQRRGVDIAFEGSGYPFYQAKALAACRHYGTLVLLAKPAQELGVTWSIDTDAELCRGHKRITASLDVAFNDRLALVELLQEPSIQKQIDILVTHRFPMTRAAEAFETILARRACKVHLLPQE